MNAHNRCGARHKLQSSADALAARDTTGYRPFAGGICRRHNNDNPVAGRLGGRHTPIEHPSITESLVLLRATEAFAGTTGNDDRPYGFTARLGWRLCWPK